LGWAGHDCDPDVRRLHPRVARDFGRRKLARGAAQERRKETGQGKAFLAICEVTSTDATLPFRATCDVKMVWGDSPSSLLCYRFAIFLFTTRIIELPPSTIPLHDSFFHVVSIWNREKWMPGERSPFQHRIPGCMLNRFTKGIF
jgi:hypothetical protein